MTDTPDIEPYALPGSVVSGELIEASWGNNVVNAIAALALRKPQFEQIYNTAVIATTATTWEEYSIGTVTLPGTFVTWDLLITVAGRVGSTGGGQCDLIVGIDGTQYPDGSATGEHVADATCWLSHTITTVLGPGTYTINAFGRTEAAGGIGPCHASIIALPNATTLDP